MDKDAIISLKGMQTTVDNQLTTIELMSEARYYKKDSNFYIIYKETEITGMEGTTTTVKVAGDAVSLIRFGTVSSTMTFEAGVKHPCNYGTSFGTLDIAIEANEVRARLDEYGGDLYVEYEVEVGGQRLGNNNFHLTVKATNSRESE